MAVQMAKEVQCIGQDLNLGLHSLAVLLYPNALCAYACEYNAFMKMTCCDTAKLSGHTI
jgi:hypothetical protein